MSIYHYQIDDAVHIQFQTNIMNSSIKVEPIHVYAIVTEISICTKVCMPKC